MGQDGDFLLGLEAAGPVAVDSLGAGSIDDLKGLYAAGDVVKGLDQISSAMGQAAIAATTIRNDLNAARPLWR